MLTGVAVAVRTEPAGAAAMRFVLLSGVVVVFAPSGRLRKAPSAPRTVGQRHQEAAMGDAARRAEIVADGGLRDDLVLSGLDHLKADQFGERHGCG